jgi:hypothetical protein
LTDIGKEEPRILNRVLINSKGIHYLEKNVSFDKDKKV